MPLPLDDLVSRFARTHVPFLLDDVVARLGVTAERALAALQRLEAAGRVVHGEFRPGGFRNASGATPACCGRSAGGRSPRSATRSSRSTRVTFVRFLSAWQGVGRGRRGTDALVEALEQLQGVAIPVSVLERDVLPVRVEGYRPAMLDELCAAGELVWTGAGALGADDGRVRLFFRDRVKLLASSVTLPGAARRARCTTRSARTSRPAGASFWPDLVSAAGTADDAVLLTALWDLVWAGEVTNDTFGPLRVPRRATAQTVGAGPAESRAAGAASARPRARAGGRWSRRCSSPRRRRRRPRTPSRSNCSSGTAS